MVTEVRVPNATAAGAKLSIGRWFKRVGDPVSFDEPLVEINTDDLTREVRAPATGVLTAILARDGQSVEPGAVLGNITQF
jgi:2-oxoglutarate dehydrogenase E2 component (dihydrolipoamide succinyltransferase)